MTPVEQTILTISEGGNCLPACIASVLEVPLESVPHPTPAESVDADDWRGYMARLDAWMAGFNLTLLGVAATKGFRPRGYALLGAQSPRGEGLHSVVCFDGEIVWDPHPKRAEGVGEWHDWLIFQALDPCSSYAPSPAP